jgi:hypothetical protein
MRTHENPGLVSHHFAALLPAGVKLSFFSVFFHDLDIQTDFLLE